MPATSLPLPPSINRLCWHYGTWVPQDGERRDLMTPSSRGSLEDTSYLGDHQAQSANKSRNPSPPPHDLYAVLCIIGSSADGKPRSLDSDMCFLPSDTRTGEAINGI